MQKQVIYPKFIPRVFAMTIDIVILSLALAPVMDFLSKHMFIYVFKDFFILNAVDIASNDAVVLAVKSPEFTNYITASKFFAYSGSLF